MDIRPVDSEPTAEERDAVDALLGAPASSWEGGERGDMRDAHTSNVGGRATRSMRHMLLPALQALQSRIGWLSEGGLGYVCDRLNVPPADAWAVATFYALLATSPRPKRVVHICDDIACKARGADGVIAAVEKQCGHAHTHAPHGSHVRIKDSDAVWMHSPCLGMCEQAPAAFVQVAGVEPSEQLIGAVTAEMAVELLAGHGAPGAGHGKLGTEHGARGTERRLLKRIGVVEQNIDAFIASGGFDALRKALRMTPDQVIAEVATSKLMGRGGAAFPTARKWEAVAKQPNTPHYFICNADESEPGTFKDRVLMEGDPFAIIEGITIGAYATGCEKGFIYIRGEYPHATDALQRAIDESRAANVLGANILGSQFTFDIEIRRGAGAYICGEETAIFESIEGKRGEPRNKPPFPAQAGLFGKPTVVNNVETLANIPHIILDGGGAFASLGTAQSTGTRLFCVSGNVERAGVYEVVYGTTLREVIDMAGGVAPDRKIQAVLLGGAAGSFMRPDELDIRLTHEDTRAANTTLGSGVIMVFDDTVNMHGIVDRIAAFFRDESCGQCVPCRVGTVRQEEALHRIGKNKTRGGLDTEIALLEEVGVAMRDASICGLGQTAYAAVESAIKRLRLYEGVGG